MNEEQEDGDRMSQTGVTSSSQSDSANNTEAPLFGERDQILAQFQEVTSIDDIGQCQGILESTNWNIDQAIQLHFSESLNSPQETANPTVTTSSSQTHNNRVVPINSTLTIPPSSMTNNDDDSSNSKPMTLPKVSPVLFNNMNMNINEGDNLSMFRSLTNQTGPNPFLNFSSTIAYEAAAAAGTSIKPPRLLQFNVEYNEKKEHFQLFDTETVYRLKELIEENLKVPKEYQIIRGWKNKDMKIKDNDLFRDLYLPRENNLFVINLNPLENLVILSLFHLIHIFFHFSTSSRFL
jgi:hypothetical protein